MLAFILAVFLPSQSVAGAIGHPNRDGARLTHAATLPLKGPGYFQRGFAPERNFATPELVGLIEAAAARWHEANPERDFQVGDMSARQGGKLKPHGSHRNGLDGDIEFFFDKDEAFETDANLELLKTFQETALDPRHPVPLNLIYVGCPVKKRLCEKLTREARLGEYAGFLSTLVIHAGHNEHFHVRIECPASSPDCVLAKSARRADEPGCPARCD